MLILFLAILIQRNDYICQLQAIRFILIGEVPMKHNSIDVESAKAAAQRLFQKINFSGGALQSYQLSTMLTDTYEYIKIPFKPTTRDIKGYIEVLDANKDGEVTLSDLETMAVYYLCGPGVLGEQAVGSTTKKAKVSFSNTLIQSSSAIENSVEKVETTFSQKPTSNKSISSFGSNRKIPISLGPSKDRTYSEKTIQYLAVTRKIFDKYADHNSTIVGEVVPDLLSETYETLGRKGYRPNSQDVKVWMKLCDSNGDGHVEYEEYEYFVVRSMERSGFQVYQ